MGKNIGGGYVYNESDSSASYEDEGFSVESLNDVDVSNPENGQALVYDSSSEKWINESVGDFDAIIHYSQPLDTSEPPVITIEHGNFATLYEMLNNGRVPTFLITYYDPIINVYWSTCTVHIYSFEEELITLMGKVPTTVSGVDHWPAFHFLWNNNDTITWN